MKFSEVTQNPVSLNQAIMRWTVLAVCLMGAMLVAYWIGTENTTMLVLCVALTVLAFVVGVVQDRAWVLIPVGWALAGTSSFLPGNFSIHDVCILLAFASFVGYWILTKRDMRQGWHTLDVILAINLLWLAFTFIRNPVGFRVTGSETIGGRPYLMTFMACLAYWVMTRLPRSPKTISWIPYMIVTGFAIGAIVNLVIYLAPSLTPYVYFLYTDVDVGSYYRYAGLEQNIVRWGQLGLFGMPLMFVLCAKYPPRTLFNPLRGRFYLFALALVAILASGFRSFVLWAFIAVFLGSWFHRGWREAVLAVVAASLLIGTLIVGQGRVYQLPLTAQRALSWLPGDWSPIAIEAGKESSEGRFEWWRDIVKNDVIKNWWLGDGFGVSAHELSLMGAFHADFFTSTTLTGGFHNGPLTSIRYAGVVGMVLFYLYMIAAAVYSVKCVRLCRGTPLQTLAIFVAIQLVWEPFHYTLVFGGYDSQVAETVFQVSLLMLAMRTVIKWKEQRTVSPPRLPEPRVAATAAGA